MRPVDAARKVAIFSFNERLYLRLDVDRFIQLDAITHLCNSLIILTSNGQIFAIALDKNSMRVKYSRFLTRIWWRVSVSVADYLERESEKSGLSSKLNERSEKWLSTACLNDFPAILRPTNLLILFSNKWKPTSSWSNTKWSHMRHNNVRAHVRPHRSRCKMEIIESESGNEYLNIIFDNATPSDVWSDDVNGWQCTISTEALNLVNPSLLSKTMIRVHVPRFVTEKLGEKNEAQFEGCLCVWVSVWVARLYQSFNEMEQYQLIKWPTYYSVRIFLYIFLWI